MARHNAQNHRWKEIFHRWFLHYGAPYALLASFLNPRIYVFFPKSIIMRVSISQSGIAYNL